MTSLRISAPRHERASFIVAPCNAPSRAAGALMPRRVVRSSCMPGVFLLKKLAGALASVSFGVLADCGGAVMRQTRPSLTQVAS